QDEKKAEERDRVLVLRGDVAGGKCLEQPEQQSADHRADGAADTAKHGGGEALERQQRSNVVARQGDGSDQDSRHRANRGGDRKGQAYGGARIDADEARGGLIRRGGNHRFADQAALDEAPQQHEDYDGAGEHHQALRQDRRAGDADRIAADKRRQAVEALVEYHLRGAAKKDRGADGDDDEHDGATAA